MEKITLRQVSDKPIGWFSRNQKIKCSHQSFKSSIENYKVFMGQEKNITKQFEELKFGDLNQSNNLLRDTYTGVVTSFVYYDNKGYRLCDSLEKQEKLLAKKNKYKDLHIKFLGVKLYHDVDLQSLEGKNEWKYHSQEHFDFLYPSEFVVTLKHLIKYEAIQQTQNIVTSRKEYIVLSTGIKNNLATIALNSLSNNYTNNFVLTMPVTSNTSNLALGSELLFYTADNTSITGTVSAKIDDTIVLEGQSEHLTSHTSTIFAYGTKVNDFHTLNKDYLFTLNFAATQELDRRLAEQSTLISQLLTQV
ncbi:MAG: hypothetical protein EBU90_15495, partial [Proteobacteria bacterium]|nr:hypothetical protein [Pseudomonadota bacterium]